MATRDTHGNIHARDGKFAEKQHTADEVTLTPSSVPNSASEMYKKMTRDGIESVASQLEEMAADIRRLTHSVDSNPVSTVSSVVHKLAWGQANLSVDGIIHNAGNALTAEAHEKAQAVSNYTSAIDSARTIEYPSAGDEARGTNATIVYDTAALEAARHQYQGE